MGEEGGSVKVASPPPVTEWWTLASLQGCHVYGDVQCKCKGRGPGPNYQFSPLIFAFVFTKHLQYKLQLCYLDGARYIRVNLTYIQ